MTHDAGKRQRICIVTTELAGPDFNGGIGTANRALALFLSDQGYQVDILYTRVEQGQPHSRKLDFEQHVRAFEARGIRLSCIFHNGAWNEWKQKSRRVMEHLKAHRYDLAIFDDTQGHAYYPLLARKTLDPDLQNTFMAVVTHSATQWIYDINGYPITNLQEVVQMEMERRTIELADAVISPSAFILDKYSDYGWTISDNAHVQPNIVSATVGQRDGGAGPIDDIVFFGRLEARKGVWQFCSAINRIIDQLQGRKITFLGKPVLEDGRSTATKLIRIAAGWPMDVQFLVDYDRDQALNYLTTGPRLAVMPSIEDNSPYAVLECVQFGIPMLASDQGGGKELVDPHDHARALVAPQPDALATRLVEICSEGASPARPSRTADQINQSYLKLIRSFLRKKKPATRKSGRKTPPLFLALGGGSHGAELDQKIANARRMLPADAEIACVAGQAATPSPASETSICGDAAQYATLVERWQADGPSRPVIVFSLDEPPAAGWCERAIRTLAATSIDAITGARGFFKAADPNEKRSFVSLPEEEFVAYDDPVGNSRTLLQLAGESNSGYAAFSGDVAAELLATGPWDERGQVYQPDIWLHLLLAQLVGSGRSFETLPDLPARAGESHDLADTFQFGMVARRVRRLLNADDALISARLRQLGSESHFAHELERQRSRFADQFEQQGIDVGDHINSQADQLRRVARIAHAAGKTELAKDISADMSLALTRLTDKAHASSDKLKNYVEALALTENLIDRIASGDFSSLNAEDEWSFKTHYDDRSVELHANPSNAGRVALHFSGVNLEKLEMFIAEVSLPGEEAKPVLCRLELQNGAGHQFRRSHVVAASETVEFSCTIPEELRGKCDVMISVEMADMLSGNAEAYTLWRAPRFVSKDWAHE